MQPDRVVGRPRCSGSATPLSFEILLDRLPIVAIDGTGTIRAAAIGAAPFVAAQSCPQAFLV